MSNTDEQQTIQNLEAQIAATQKQLDDLQKQNENSVQHKINPDLKEKSKSKKGLLISLFVIVAVITVIVIVSIPNTMHPFEYLGEWELVAPDINVSFSLFLMRDNEFVIVSETLPDYYFEGYYTVKGNFIEYLSPEGLVRLEVIGDTMKQHSPPITVRYTITKVN